MRVAVILVCAVATVLGNDVEIELDFNVTTIVCPTDPNTETFFPHQHCGKFYQCSNGLVIERQCSANLMFDKDTLRCDWSYKVDCSGRNITESRPEQNESSENEDSDDGTCNSDPAEAPEICAQPNSDGVLIASEDCNHFYKCANHEPISLKCPKDLVFNPCTRWCDWVENVDCGNRTVSEYDDEGTDGNNGDNETEKPGPVDNVHVNATELCAQEGSNGLLVPHEHCNKFYTCFDEKLVAQWCSEGLVYNPDIHRCDWPDNVNCGNKTMAEPEKNDNGSDGGNNETEKPGPVDNVHVNATELCAQEGSNGLLVPHEHCNKFYTCFDEKLVAQWCSEGLVYNPGIHRCDWPDNVNCGNKTMAEPEKNDNGSDGGNNETEKPGPVDNVHVNATELCAQEGSNGLLVPHEHCNKFYTCFDEKLVAQWCSEGLVYNPDIHRCDWPDNVNCGNKTMAEPEKNDNGSDGGNNETEKPGPVDNVHVNATELCAQEGSNGLLVPHEHCNKFYTCFDEKLVAQWCSEGLVYNPDIHRCDWPDNVNCGNKTMAEPEKNDNGSDGGNNETEKPGPVDNVHVNATELCAQEGSNGLLVPHEHCNKFYTCFDEKLVAQWCSEGLVYNPDIHRCDWPDNVNCGNKTMAEPEKNDNGSDGGNNETEKPGPVDNVHVNATELCAQEGSNGLLVPHEHCNKFYTCFDEKLVAQWCSEGLVYNPDIHRCDWPDNVNCGNKTMAEPEKNDNGSDGGNNETEKPGPVDNVHVNATEFCAQEGSNGLLVAHEHCNKFYTCIDEKLVAQWCSEGLVYNPDIHSCDWPDNVNCGNKTMAEPEKNDNGSDGGNTDNGDSDNTEGPINGDPSEAPAICAQEESDGTLIAHESCDKFYICDLYVPVAVKCGRGLYYNANKSHCDWSGNVDCGDRVIPDHNDTNSESDNEETCNCDPSEAPEICARDGSNGVLIAHEKCNQYYKCYAGKPNVLQCSNNHLYNPQKGWCDRAASVDCGDRIVPDNNNSTENDDPTKASEICARKGSDGALVAHEMCNKFFKCSHGVPVEIECQSGLLYNMDLEICDWPSQVNCGERQQQSE